MGLELVEKFRRIGIEPVTINRGNTYWGRNDQPSVRADRRDPNAYRDSIQSVMSSDRTWLGVVDFCAYRKRDIMAIPDKIFSIMPVYIFVSTDSVYEVCLDDDSRLPVREDMASVSGVIRPTQDKYGYNKLQCEFLLSQRATEKCRVISLRLPDVLGPFDDTRRLWGMKCWIQSGIPLPSSSQVVSFCYSIDVVDLMVHLLQGASLDSPPDGGAFNIGCEEQIPMCEFVDILREIIGVSELKDYIGRFSRKTYLPSVEVRGVPLCLEKAKRLLGFKPTPLRVVLEETIEWLNLAEKLYPKEFFETVSDLPCTIRIRYCDIMGVDFSGSSCDTLSDDSSFSHA
jgi:hypothetical protein